MVVDSSPSSASSTIEPFRSASIARSTDASPKTNPPSPGPTPAAPTPPLAVGIGGATRRCRRGRSNSPESAPKLGGSLSTAHGPLRPPAQALRAHRSSIPRPSSAV
eukprot:3959895-Prymnesium_polylepis.1